jgi:tetratricopeptide (TPR) repeat protein
MKVVPVIAILAISLISTGINATSSSYCGELINVHDYIEGDKQLLKTVEQHHFTPNIESLRHGNSGTLGSELSYTLMFFPNHHRALAAFSKLSLRDKTLKSGGAKYSVGCFFDRAIRFKPNDAMLRMVYGNHLLKTGEIDKAVEQLQLAADLQPENATINYNLGLLYLKQKDYEQAKTYAKKAYELEFPLPGLKNQLKQVGKWEE